MILFLFFSSISLSYSSVNNKQKTIEIAYLNQKYPYFYLEKKFLNQEKGKENLNIDQFNGIEYYIIKEFVNASGLKVNISSYDKNKNYDIIIGGIIYSKQIEELFNLYFFLSYFEDSISVYSLKEKNFSISNFKNSNYEKIGVLMYSYAYYLIRQYIPGCKIYAYEEDIVNDLIENKIDFIVLDDKYSEIPNKYSKIISNLGSIYIEKIGFLVLKSNSYILKVLEDIIKKLDFQELLKWLK